MLTLLAGIVAVPASLLMLALAVETVQRIIITRRRISDTNEFGEIVPRPRIRRQF